MRHAQAMSIALLGLTACAGAAPVAQPVTIARPAFGGEAQFRGQLAMEKGCIVAGDSRKSISVLFDPGVKLLDAGQGVFDPATGQSIRFGEPVTGGAPSLRDNGRGWSISDIESFYGVSLPPGCPRANVMRLHHFTQIRGRND